MIPTEAIILVGGLGTRLRAVVSDMPKPLAPVANRPFLHWLLDGLARQGISHVVLATGYMGDVIREALGERFEGMELDYAHEKTSLGTGGALWGALKQCREQRVFVLNGDTWLGQSLHLLAAEAPDADLVLSVRSVTDRSRYGSVRVEGNRVLGLEEKGPSGPGLVNGGVYLARRDLIIRQPMHETFSLEMEILSKPGALDIRAHLTETQFIDIGTPDDYLRAQLLIPAWAAR